MKFTELGLTESIVRAVADKGYTDPTPIQAKAIPAALEGRDVLGTAQTGTGKTCAFALPILHLLDEDQNHNHKAKRNRGRGRAPRALVLAPTRELASQIFDSFIAYGKHLKLRHAVVFGGVNQRKQVAAMREGIDVLVATPGRLHDLIQQGHIDLSEIEILVLDEADRMLDMGFINDIRKVVSMVREDRQTLFFSATVSREIRQLANALLHDPITIETTPEATTVDTITQRIYMIDKENKKVLLCRVLAGEDVTRALVFSKTKHGADKIVKGLRGEGIEAEAIHGNKTQNNRTKALKKFKSGAVRVLVATDIASRGIDVNDITHVVNYDMPVDPETYVHRIGRTARAGASGIALSFCDREEIGKYRAIEKRAKLTIEVGTDHEDLTFEAPAAQRHERSGGGGTRTRGPRREFDNRAPKKAPRSKNAKRAARKAGPATAKSGYPKSDSGGAGRKPSGPRKKTATRRAG
ncbi:MAG: DEAD/DEAH box helicase [Phycisphaerales bacterium]